MYNKKLKGSITVPGDKSISHRAVMFASIAKGVSHIKGFLNGADCISTINCFRQMGIEIEQVNDKVTVKGKGMYGLTKPGKELYCGNSGTTVRLLSGILSAQHFSSSLNGDESIQKRPMARVIEPLKSMGANITSFNNSSKTPLFIEPSCLHGIHYKSPVASAQVKSAILLAGLYAKGETLVEEIYKSRNHTELMLESFGAKVSSAALSASVSTTAELFANDITVPGDISSAAYFLVAALISPGSELLIKNVGINPTRDGVIKVLKDMGANIEIINSNDEFEPVADIKVSYSKLHATTIGGDIIPTLIDELPLLAAIASLAEGKTIIKDAAELKVKESNRIKVMCEELSKLGVNVVETEDGMEIEGTNKLFGNVTISTHDDHRIAMTFAILGLISEGEIKLDNKACVEISYPEFFDDLRKVNI
jgi:3-phosphoshikimate 1-carboxyvinyltransferase